MTATELSKRLGIGRSTLFHYRREWPDRVPKGFDDLDAWNAFIVGIKVYDAGRTKADVELTAVAPGDDQEYSAQAERKERIIKLKLANALKEEEFKIFKRNSVPIQDAIETVAGIAATARAEFLELPGEVAEAMSGKNANEIQVYLEIMVRKILDKLVLPETFLRPQIAGD